MSITHSQALRFIEELQHNVNASGNRPAERRLADLTLWFYKNFESFASNNVEGQVAFLKKAMWIQLEMNALLLERLHEMEMASKPKHLWTPRGINVEGNIREFG